MATKEKTSEELRLWLMSLEAERHDATWRHPAMNKFEPQIVYVDRPINTRYRDNVMFHAGRYAEGARDQKAIKAHARAQKLIKEEKSN